MLLGYQLYDVARADYGMSRSQAAFQLGVLGLVQFVPFFICTPMAGIAADRFDRRMVVAISSLVDAVLAALLAYLTWRGVLNLPILFGLAAGHGAVRVFTGPALMSIAPNIVPPDLLPRAIAISSIVFTIGAVSGPALGGFLFAVDGALPHAISALFFLITTTVMLSMRRIQARQSEHRVHPVKQMIEGFQFIWRERFLLGCITLDLFAVLLGGATALLPVFARDILHVGARRPRHDARRAGCGGRRSWRCGSRSGRSTHNVGVKMLLGGRGLRRGDDRLRPFAQLPAVAGCSLACSARRTWSRSSSAARWSSSTRPTTCAGACHRSRSWRFPPRTNSAKCSPASLPPYSVQQERLYSAVWVR